MGAEPKIGVLKPPKWMAKIMENPMKIHDLGVPLFLETPIYIYIYIYYFGCFRDAKNTPNKKKDSYSLPQLFPLRFFIVNFKKPLGR